MESPIKSLYYDEVKHNLKAKLHQEVMELEERVRLLRGSNSKNRDLMISTYQRIIENKQHFMRSCNL
ncbi:MAG: hypothetical protein MI864_28175 [Pseudomonadales bacterium]|uniref:Uncharacterized protein n=1 Tax=Oleiphilus messinensis TaxID=141451 RepID=A0A1Y0I135_9GAMM|nr:hypothetical protein [Oleiphilus messinensis]ARU54167.1 hypothetical protein OLMES_0058 [Oleiphilus messinensis]MCG8614407.1 hypothetical protein [Pseudomonadales bacterium]